MTKLKSSSRFLLSEGALWHVNVLNQLPIVTKVTHSLDILVSKN